LTSFVVVVVVVVAVKDVVLKLKPLLTKNKLLVSVAAGIKLKDLQVTVYLIIFLLHFCI
jgi:pyrroline-5-carboxylate reductase